jgi:hypothetical protein
VRREPKTAVQAGSNSARQEPQLSPKDEVKRPFGVTLLALFCFSKAALFLLLVVMTLAHPESPSGTALLQHFIPIPTDSTGGRQGIVSPEAARKRNELGALILVPGIAIFAALGFGLWFLQKWAWNIIMVTSGMAFAAWARYMVIEVLLNVSLRTYRPATSDVLREMSVEGLILMYLFIVRDAFSKDRT